MPLKSAATPKTTRKPAARPSPKVAEPDQPAPRSTQALDPQTREVLIRIAAYSFYERRGFIGGHELEDWLRAEMEVDRQIAERGAAPKSESAP